MQFGRSPATSSARFRAQNLRLSLTLLLAVALAALFVGAPRASAQDEVTLDAGGDTLELHGSRNMPPDNPRVEPILKKYPDKLVVICVAGCDGKSRAVQVLTPPSEARTAAYMPTAGDMGSANKGKRGSGKQAFGPPRPAKGDAKVAIAGDEVVCLAGCSRKPGQVVQRISNLPPEKAVAPPPSRPAKLDALPKLPENKRALENERPNEPLDVDP